MLRIVAWDRWRAHDAGQVAFKQRDALPDLRELLNDNDPSVCPEALVALENLAGKGAPPAELKSLSAHRWSGYSGREPAIVR
jgi:HEAT repeat protein